MQEKVFYNNCNGVNMKKNKHIHGLIFFITIMLTANFVIGGNLLKNGGFEIKSVKPGKNLFCQDWPITLSSKAKNCRGELSTDAYKGKYSLKLILEGDKKTNDLWTGQKIKASSPEFMGKLRFGQFSQLVI
jgi:hypothetical protein